MPATPPLTPLSEAQLQTLMASLNPARVAKLDKGRTALSYLEAWDVKATLIRVFGFGGFSAEADECEIVMIENNVPKTSWVNRQKQELPIEREPDGQIKFGTANFRVTARVRVKLTIHQLGAVYTEWAAASQTGPDLGEVTDFAIKTAESDALKRAAVYLGNQFGMTLYNDGATQDVIKRVVAPGQEWPRPAQPAPQPQQAEPAAEQAEPTPEQEVANLQNIVDGGNNELPWTGGVSEEQRQANQALVDRATNMRREREAAATQTD